jgi:hypothetical protein
MKNLAISILAILMLTLTACGAASSGTQPASAPQNGSLPIQMQILIGTFKLEGTDQAITSQQAAELLPLWQVYKDLSSSDTAALEEIDGLIQQIQDSMTSDQMKAITDMNLTRQDMFTVMQDQGIAQAGGQGNGSRTNSQNGNGGGFTPPDGFVPPDGGPPGGFGGGEPGGFPGGGGGGQGNQTFSPEQVATAQAAREQGGGFNRLPPGLIDALIQFLEMKAGS